MRTVEALKVDFIFYFGYDFVTTKHLSCKRLNLLVEIARAPIMLLMGVRFGVLPEAGEGDAGEVDAGAPVGFVAGVVGDDELVVFDEEAWVAGVAS